MVYKAKLQNKMFNPIAGERFYLNAVLKWLSSMKGRKPFDRNDIEALLSNAQKNGSARLAGIPLRRRSKLALISEAFGTGNGKKSGYPDDILERNRGRLSFISAHNRALADQLRKAFGDMVDAGAQFDAEWLSKLTARICAEYFLPPKYRIEKIGSLIDYCRRGLKVFYKDNTPKERLARAAAMALEGNADVARRIIRDMRIRDLLNADCAAELAYFFEHCERDFAFAHRLWENYSLRDERIIKNLSVADIDFVVSEKIILKWKAGLPLNGEDISSAVDGLRWVGLLKKKAGCEGLLFLSRARQNIIKILDKKLGRLYRGEKGRVISLFISEISGKFDNKISAYKLPRWDNYLYERWNAVADCLKFRDYVLDLIIESENEFRHKKRIPPVGDPNPSGTRLFYIVKKIFPDYEILREAGMKWLGRQRFDIFLPELGVAIERMGEQHYKPVKVFGGARAFSRNQARDRRKRLRALEHGINVINVPFDCELSEESIGNLLRSEGLPVKVKNRER